MPTGEISPTLDAAPSIRARALAIGFDAVGIAAVGRLEAVDHYEAWLGAGRHGTMDYLATERHRERRADPARVLPGIRSVVCVALCYEPEAAPADAQRRGRIARYALGEDYHRIMRDKLEALEDAIRDAVPGAATRSYSDTGAILERGWAERAGLGWIGKNSCLISPRLGSWLLLGEILVDRDLEADAPFATHNCGTCRRCLDVCPTGALVAPQQLDARLCISYLTIELRGPIPIELRPLVGDWIFGCDLCQDVCPWNRFAPPAREARLKARALDGWTLTGFLDLDEAGFQRLFHDSPIKRAKRVGFLRNVCVALGNRGDRSAVPSLLRALERDAEALVRGHAAWALGEIASRGEPDVSPVAAALERAASHDSDAWVREEASGARVRLT